MDKNVEILLNSHKNINAVNVDTFNKIELTNSISKILEYSIDNVLSATEIFDAEREANKTYRIYGKIEYMSLLNGLSEQYRYLSDFFTPEKILSKNLLNSFDFYLVKPSNEEYISYLIDDDLVSGRYVRRFDVIATPNEFDLYKVGFSKNVFGEQSYAFNFSIDFDASTYYDSFNFPVTELFLYVVYKRGVNGGGVAETMQYTFWNTILQAQTKQTFNATNLIIGDRVYGDLINYSEKLFEQTQVTPQTYYISTPYKDDINAPTERLDWKYNPFIPFKLRYLSDDLYSANTGDTTYDLVEAIPNYATSIDDNGNYVWRTILPQGYIDPLTSMGVDYPFMNKRRYLFSNIILDIKPNLDDTNTENVFNEIWFTKNAQTINVTPINNLDDIGKPCQ